MNRGARREGRSWTAATATGPRDRSPNPSHEDAGSAADARRKLEALFGGGGPGDGQAAQFKTHNVFSAPRKQKNGRPSEHSMRLQRLRLAREPQEIEEAANVFFAHHAQMPDDMDILIKLLLHSSERILCDAMGQISGLLTQRRQRPTIILTDRLKDLSERTLSANTQSCVDGLRSQIARLAG